MGRRHSLTVLLAAAVTPCVNFRSKRVDGPQFVVNVAMDGQALFFLPSHDCSNAAFQVRSDFLPRLQPVSCRVVSFELLFRTGHERGVWSAAQASPGNERHGNSLPKSAKDAVAVSSVL
jgi:hypothetical protein